jgi:hypothetical protein
VVERRGHREVGLRAHNGEVTPRGAVVRAVAVGAVDRDKTTGPAVNLGYTWMRLSVKRIIVGA